MENNKKSLLARYGVCFLIATIMLVCVFAVKGFFTDNAKDNVQVLVDGFFSTGILMIMFYGLLYVSSEGAFLGIGYALTFAFRALIPFTKKTHETYKDYRERKTAGKKTSKDSCVFFTGLTFVIVSLILLAIWYKL